MNFNRVIIGGRLTRDPELRFLPNNTAVCDFALALNERYLNKTTEQWEDRPVFVEVTAFGRTGENVNKFFSKGTPILCEGRLRFEQWEDRQSGEKRSKLKVVCDSWQFVERQEKSEPASSGYAGGDW